MGIKTTFGSVHLSGEDARQFEKQFIRHSVICNICRKFISQKSIMEKKSKFVFLPDSELGPEESYWECEKCS